MNFIENIWNGLFNGCSWFLINCFGASKFELQDGITPYMIGCLVVLIVALIIGVISLIIYDIKIFLVSRELKALVLLHDIRVGLLKSLTYVVNQMVKNNIVYDEDMCPALYKVYCEFNDECDKLIKLLDSKKTKFLIEISIFSNKKKIANRLFKSATDKIEKAVADFDYNLA